MFGVILVKQCPARSETFPIMLEQVYLCDRYVQKGIDWMLHVLLDIEFFLTGTNVLQKTICAYNFDWLLCCTVSDQYLTELNGK
mgnify:CR=1 FL=1